VHSCGQVLVVKSTASETVRRGQRGWVIAVLDDRERYPLKDLPPGVIYSVEFEDGEAVDMHEDDLESQ